MPFAARVAHSSDPPSDAASLRVIARPEAGAGSLGGEEGFEQPPRTASGARRRYRAPVTAISPLAFRRAAIAISPDGRRGNRFHSITDQVEQRLLEHRGVAATTTRLRGYFERDRPRADQLPRVRFGRSRGIAPPHRFHCGVDGRP